MISRTTVVSMSLVLVALAPTATMAGDGSLVSLLTDKLGVTEPQASGGAGALLSMAQGQLGGDQFSQVTKAVPEVLDLVEAAPSLGGMTDVDLGGDLLGQGGGDMLSQGLQLAGAFDGLGLDASMVQSFTPLVVSYVQDKGGESVGGLLSGALTSNGKAGSGLSGLASAAPLIGLLSDDLGVNGAQAAGGAGALLGVAQSQLGEDDFGSIVDAVPGVMALIDTKPKEEESNDLLGAASSLLGGGGGSGGQILGALGLADSFEKLGLDAGMVERFIPLVLSYVQGKGGDEISGLLAGVLGGSPKSEGSGTEQPVDTKTAPAGSSTSG